MALFKKRLTADEIIKAISDLSNDERDQVMSAIGEQGSEPEENSEIGSPASDEAHVDQESQTDDLNDEDTLDDESLEDVANEAGNAPESAEDETVNEPAAEEPQNATEEAAAQDAKYAALESEIKNLKAMLESVLEKAEAQSFGVSPSLPQSDEDDEDDRIMRSYYGASYNRAKV